MKIIVLAMIAISVCATDLFAQNRKPRRPGSSGQTTILLEDDFYIHQPPPLQIRDYSPIFVEIPKAREIKVHDLVKIIVNEKSEAQVTSSGNSRRNSSFKAQLKEFVRIRNGRLANAADNEPTIDFSVNKQVQAQARLNDKENLTFRITAMVVDILPNGNVILEARKQISLPDDVWGFSLTGMVRAVDITADNTVLSEDMYNPNFKKIQKGKIYNTTRRPWGTKIFEFIWPFG